LAIGGKDGNAAVIGIDHIKIPIGIHGNPLGIIESIPAAAWPADGSDQFARRIEYFNAIAASVGDVNQAVGSDSDTIRFNESIDAENLFESSLG
jgi:hypothetical protein